MAVNKITMMANQYDLQEWPLIDGCDCEGQMFFRWKELHE